MAGMANRAYDAPPGFDWIARLTGWSEDGGALRLELETAQKRAAGARVEALSADVWRWTFLPPGAKDKMPTPSVVWPAGQRIPLRIEKTDAGLAVRARRTAWRLEFQADPWAMRFVDAHGRAVFGENPGDVDGLGRPFVPPLGFVRRNRRTEAVIQSFHLSPEDRLYGLGEKFTRLDKTHQTIVSWTQDALGSTSERSHKNVPFVWSPRGWGLFVDTGARVVWELGTRSCQSFTVRVEDGALDAYLIRGRTPAEMIERYTELTGRPPVPPKWSFGLWLSSGGTYRTRAEVESLVAGASRRRLPFDVVHVDPWWMRRRRYCDFRWDRRAFPDPEGFVRRLHERGLKLCLWEHPYISVESELFAYGKRRGYFLKGPHGKVLVIDYGLSLAPRPDGLVRRAAGADSWNARVAIIDLTHGGARAWFKDLHRPLLRMGVDVFKTDFGEDVPAEAVFHDGRTGAELHNLYPLIYSQAVAEVTAEEGGSGLVWSRSGTAGSQRYPVGWSGDPAADWDSLAATVRGGLSAGMSGLAFWSNDIGGYRGRPSPELYVRWAQFGLFCSHSRMHGDSPREPWAFGPKAEAIVAKFVRLRYRLFPYLYSLAHEAARTGLPVLRALPFEFPGDPNAHGHDLEFMLGPWLLVAPVVHEGGERDVYLPYWDERERHGNRRAGKEEGKTYGGAEWIDFWSGRRHPAGRTLRIKSPLSRIPVFVRAGAILPMMPDAERIPEGPIARLKVQVYPGVPSRFTLFEDEGPTDFDLARAGNRFRLIVRGWRPKGSLKIVGRPR
ncbi:MAG: TIM-barrel domain-containing protein [Candidatus Aminicenantales bacterium]